MMNEAWEKSDVVFAAMFQQRTSPIYQKIKNLRWNFGEVRREADHYQLVQNSDLL